MPRRPSRAELSSRRFGLSGKLKAVITLCLNFCKKQPNPVLIVSDDNISQNAKAVKNMMAQGCAGFVLSNIFQVQINSYGSQILDLITVFLFTKI